MCLPWCSHRNNCWRWPPAGRQWRCSWQCFHWWLGWSNYTGSWVGSCWESSVTPLLLCAVLRWAYFGILKTKTSKRWNTTQFTAYVILIWCLSQPDSAEFSKYFLGSYCIFSPIYFSKTKAKNSKGTKTQYNMACSVSSSIPSVFSYWRCMMQRSLRRWRRCQCGVWRKADC